MTRTIQELREARGESQAALAASLGVSPNQVAEWETGTAEPTITYLLALTQHFDIRDDQINLRPQVPPSLGERIADVVTGTNEAS
jgi:transcriptional regulator with XRE-family HTH domain